MTFNMQATSCLLLLPSPKSQNENERLCTVWPSTINQRGSVFLLLLLLSWLAKDGSRLARQSLISLTPEILSGCIADKLVQRNLQYSATQHNRYHFILVAIPKYISMQRCRNTNLCIPPRQNTKYTRSGYCRQTGLPCLWHNPTQFGPWAHSALFFTPCQTKFSNRDWRI